MTSVKTIGVLTGGGDAPGLNPAIKGPVYRAADALADGEPGKLVSARGIAPACELALVEITSVLGKINIVEVERHYDTERYHLKNIGR